MKHISIKNINSLDIKKAKKLFINSRPFPHLIIDNFLNEKSINSILKNFNDTSRWTNCSLVNNFNKYQLNNKYFMNQTTKELFSELGSNDFIKIVSQITGIKNIFLDSDLDGGGLHQIFNNGYLNIHTDYSSHIINKSWSRELNLLIYINKNWKEKYNGNLELWDENVKKMVKSIVPIYNRCVIFKTDNKSFHGHPNKLNLPLNMSRKSIAAYYFIENNKDLDLYSTNFVSRPNDKFAFKILIKFDSYLNKIFSFLKRKKIVDNNFASKILNKFKRFSK